MGYRLEECHEQWLCAALTSEDNRGGIPYLSIEPNLAYEGPGRKFGVKEIEYLLSLHKGIEFISFWFGDDNVIIPVKNFSSV